MTGPITHPTNRPTTRDDALALDATDPLARWRDEFVVVDPALVYLDGNSLGMTPKRTVDALRHAVEEQWAGDLITSWWKHDWIDLPLTVGDELAPLIGARPGEVAVHDSTTVCLFQLVNAALDLAGTTPRHGQVIAVADTEFPTDRYVADGIARLRGTDAVRVQRDLDDLADVDVVVRSLVDYRTAELVDMASENERAEAAGAVIVWDLSHAVGVVEIDLTGAGAMLAAGCTYKFLNGGPGAPGFTFASGDLHDRIVQPIWGWFAQTDQFAMDAPFDARTGAARMLNGTPDVLSMLAARSGISVTVDAGIAAVAGKATTLASFAIDTADAMGLACNTRRPPATSGGHIVIRHPEAERLQRELAERKVIVDKRDPDVLRFGLSPLTTRYVDVYDALATLAGLVSEAD